MLVFAMTHTRIMINFIVIAVESKFSERHRDKFDSMRVHSIISMKSLHCMYCTHIILVSSYVHQFSSHMSLSPVLTIYEWVTVNTHMLYTKCVNAIVRGYLVKHQWMRKMRRSWSISFLLVFGYCEIDIMMETCVQYELNAKCYLHTCVEVDMQHV